MFRNILTLASVFVILSSCSKKEEVITERKSGNLVIAEAYIQATFGGSTGIDQNSTFSGAIPSSSEMDQYGLSNLPYVVSNAVDGQGNYLGSILEFQGALYYLSTLNGGNLIVVDIQDPSTTYQFGWTYNQDYEMQMIDLDGVVIALTPPGGGEEYCQARYLLSVGLCASAGLGMAASDGPLPFMDSIAAAFVIGCIADAALDLEECLNK